MYNDIIQALRLNSSILPLISLLVGCLVSGGTVVDVDFIITIVIIIAMNSGMTLFNDMHDRAVDAANGRPKMSNYFESSRHMPFVVVTLGLVAVSLGLAAYVSSVMLLITIAGLLAGVLYSQPPFRLSRRPIVSIVSLSFAASFIPFIAGVSLGYKLSLGLYLAGAWWIMRASLSLLKDYKDAVGDAKHHKKTFLLVYGASSVAWTSLGLFISGAIGVLSMMWIHFGEHPVAFISIAVVIWSSWLRYSLLAMKTYRQMDDRFSDILRYQALLEGCFVAWLISL